MPATEKPESDRPTFKLPYGYTFRPRSVDEVIVDRLPPTPLEREMAGDGCHKGEVARNHVKGMLGDVEGFIGAVALELNRPTLFFRRPVVRKLMRAALLAATQLREEVYLLDGFDERMGSHDDFNQAVVESHVAERLKQLEEQNADLRERLGRASTPPPRKVRRKPAKKPAEREPGQVDLPKPLFERMNASVNGNGHHAANGKHR